MFPEMKSKDIYYLPEGDIYNVLSGEIDSLDLIFKAVFC